MSTFDGHSALQPLHSRQRSITSYRRRPVNSLAGSRPESTARSALARPRAECSSSLGALYDGHIVPSSVLRQAPTPLHISIEAAKTPRSEKSSNGLVFHLVVRAPQ